MADIEVISDLTELTEEQLHAEYALINEMLAYHKEQVGYVSAQLHELNVKLASKKKDRDKYVDHYDAIRAEFTRRKNVRKGAKQGQ